MDGHFKDFAELEQMTRCDVEIDPIDHDFFDLAREAEKGAPQQRSEGTRVVQAMGDEEAAPDARRLRSSTRPWSTKGQTGRTGHGEGRSWCRNLRPDSRPAVERR